MSLLSIFFIHLLALASPGPDFVYISQIAANYNKRSYSLAILGVCSAIAIWALLAISGLSIIIEHTPIIYKLLLLLGGSYLIWLGISAVRSCFNKSQITATNTTKQHSFYIKGLMTNLANPKSLAYFGSIFSVAVAHATPHTLLLMFILVVIESLIWFYLVATLFSTRWVANWYQKRLNKINFVCGVAFVLFGLGLIYRLISDFI